MVNFFHHKSGVSFNIVNSLKSLRMSIDSVQQSHFLLLIDKLKTGDYFEYAATLSGFNNINYQISFYWFYDVFRYGFIFMKFQYFV